MPAQIVTRKNIEITNPLTRALIASQDVDGLVDALSAAEQVCDFDLAHEIVEKLSAVGPSTIPKLLAAMADVVAGSPLPSSRLGLVGANISKSLLSDDESQAIIAHAISNLRSYHTGEAFERLTRALGVFPPLSSEIVSAKMLLYQSGYEDHALRHIYVKEEREEIVEAILGYTQHKSSSVRRLAICMLANLTGEHPNVREKLKDLITDTDHRIGIAATVALASQSGDRDAGLSREFRDSRDQHVYQVEVAGVKNLFAKAEELLKLHLEVFSDLDSMQDWTASLFTKILQLQPKNRYVLNDTSGPFIVLTIREQGDPDLKGFAIAGHVDKKSDQILLAVLGIKQELRGRGIARNMLDFAEQLFSRIGYSTMLRQSRVETGWAKRVKNNLLERGLLISSERQSSCYGDQQVIVMKLPGATESALS